MKTGRGAVAAAAWIVGGAGSLRLPRGSSAETAPRRPPRGSFEKTRPEAAPRAQVADQLDWVVPLDANAVERGITRGAPGIKPRTLRDDRALTHGVGPYERIHGKYDTHPDLQGLYRIPKDARHIFEGALLRLKLLRTIVELPPRAGGCGVNFRHLQHARVILAAYPLHDDAARDRLYETFSMHAPPIETIRAYMGERLALYFAFLHHLTRGCALSAFVGVLTTMGMPPRPRGIPREVAAAARAGGGCRRRRRSVAATRGNPAGTTRVPSWTGRGRGRGRCPSSRRSSVCGRCRSLSCGNDARRAWRWSGAL